MSDSDEFYASGETIGKMMVSEIEENEDISDLDKCLIYSAIFDVCLIRMVQIMKSEGDSSEKLGDHYGDIVKMVTRDVVAKKYTPDG